MLSDSISKASAGYHSKQSFLQIKDIFKTATLRQSSVTLIGTLINGALGLLFYIVAARSLGPENFGLLSVSIVFLTMLADLADLGTNTGLVRFVAGKVIEDRKKVLEVLKISLLIKLLVWFSILIIGFILAPFIASQIFYKNELAAPLRLAMLGVGGAMLFSYATSALQAFQKFLIWSSVNIVINLLRLILLTLFVFMATIDLSNALIIYISMPFLGFLIASFFLPTLQVLSAELKLPREMIKFNASVAVFTFFAAISARLDTFITARLLDAHEIGIYSSANQLTAFVPQLISALGVVVAPKFASFDTQEKMLIFLKKLQLMVSGIALFGLLIIPVAYFLIPLIYGQSYEAATVPFIFLLLGMLVFLISIPIHNSIFYYFGKPEVFIWVSIGHLLVIGVLGYYLIGQYGVLGAALTVLTGMVFNFIAPLIWFLIRIKRSN